MIDFNTRKNRILALLAILGLAFVLRIILINKVPAGLQADEGVSLYHSFSLAETGRDPLGYSWPVHFSGFGWGENTTLAYILIPLVKLVGLQQIWPYRLFMVLLHLIFILFGYLLAKELFGSKIALLSSLFLALSPWDMVLSRLLFNVSLLPLLYMAGLYFLLKGIRHGRKWGFLWAGLIFSLSFYTYALSFLWVPLLLIILLIVFGNEINKLRKLDYLVFLVPLCILSLPIILFHLKTQTGILPNLTSWLNLSWPPLTVTRFNQVSFLGFAAYLWPIYFLRNYFLHFSPIFLLSNATLSIFPKALGITCLFSFPFLIFGLLAAIAKFRQQNYKLILIWLLLAPIPVAFTMESLPHPLRFINAMPVLEILMAIGFYPLYQYYLKLGDKKKYYLATFLIFIILNLGLYFYDFYKIYPQDSFLAFQGADQEITNYIQSNYAHYDKFIIPLNSEANLTPYNYMVYSEYPPLKVQQAKSIHLGGDFLVDKVEFKRGLTDLGEPNVKILYLVADITYQAKYHDRSVIKEFKDLKNKTIIWAIN